MPCTCRSRSVGGARGGEGRGLACPAPAVPVRWAVRGPRPSWPPASIGMPPPWKEGGHLAARGAMVPCAATAPSSSKHQALAQVGPPVGEVISARPLSETEARSRLEMAVYGILERHVQAEDMAAAARQRQLALMEKLLNHGGQPTTERQEVEKSAKELVRRSNKTKKRAEARRQQRQERRDSRDTSKAAGGLSSAKGGRGTCCERRKGARPSEGGSGGASRTPLRRRRPRPASSKDAGGAQGRPQRRRVRL